jgi:hypothetical protein
MNAFLVLEGNILFDGGDCIWPAAPTERVYHPLFAMEINTYKAQPS